MFTWYAIVDDGKLQNRSKPFIFYTKATPPDNEPPVPSAGGPYFVEINETVEFTSAGSYDPDGEIVFYRWNFGDGSSEILKENPTHKYLSPMEYQVTLTVIDNSGSSSSVKTFTSVSTIYNDPPVAKIVIPEKEYVGKKIVFDSSDSYDPDDDNLFYTWDFGNGEFSNSPQPSFSYSSSGTYLVQLNISDGEYFDIDIATIKIVSKKSEGIPGFEFLTLCLSIITLIAVISRRRLIK